MGIFNFFKQRTQSNILKFESTDQQLDFEYIKKIRKKIEDLDLTNVSPDAIFDLIKSFIENQPGYTVRFDDNIIYRSVSYSNKPEYLNQLIYPPADKAKQNRANRQGVSMFYGSFDRVITLFEINAKIGDYVALSKWKLVNPIIVAQAGYSKLNFTKEREIPNWGKFNNTEFNLEIQSYVMDFIAEMFSMEIDTNNMLQYKLTNAIAEVITRKEHRKGIVYPTIKLKGANDNIVLQKSVIDSGDLQFVNVEWLKVIDIVDNSFTVDHIDFSRDCGLDNFIYWKGGPGEWKLDDYPGWYRDEEGGWAIIRSANGDIIEKN